VTETSKTSIAVEHHSPIGQPHVPLVTLTAEHSRVFARELDRPRPIIARGKGVWLYDVNGKALLDAVSGGAMITNLGHGRADIARVAEEQASRVGYLYDQQFTSEPHEQLARELGDLAGPGFGRVHFVSGGSEANEAAMRLIRSYHVERGEPTRWRFISPAQAYHGPTIATLGLTGRPGLQAPYQPYIQPQLHIPPSSWRFDPSGDGALAALDQVVAEHGADTIAGFLCEPVSAAAFPAYSPPERFWTGLAERRERYGFLIAFDEVVTGIGRTGTWFAADQLPLRPDIITTAKGLGAGYAAIGAMICQEHVYEAIAAGSRAFEHGHTWGGAPMSCAVGLAVLDALRREHLIERVHNYGPALHEQLEDALADVEMVKEVRGRGYLLGISYIDPENGELLDPALRVARRIDEAALERELLVYSTQPTSDGFTGDQTLIAPAFVAEDEELTLMIDRLTDAIAAVARDVKRDLERAATR
jgi:adenosylmethionine-8-amino-7-oxononanoate aminotransferase